MPPIDRPNFTQVPNIVFDAIAEMGEAETKVMMILCRQTFGWHRDEVTLSHETLALFTGMTKKSVAAGLNSLVERGWVSREKSGYIFAYRVNIAELPAKVNFTLAENGPENLKVASIPAQNPLLPPETPSVGILATPLKRKGQRKAKEISPSSDGANGDGKKLPVEKKSKRVASPPHPEHAVFIEMWCEAFEIQFQRPYHLVGGKDGSAVREILKHCGSAEAAMKIATMAWEKAATGNRQKYFDCMRATDLAGFNSAMNNIVAQLHIHNETKEKGQKWAQEIERLTAPPTVTTTL